MDEKVIEEVRDAVIEIKALETRLHHLWHSLINNTTTISDITKAKEEENENKD